MINLNDLQFFAHVADYGGFAPASRALGIPKSTLSKRVAELERSLNVRLIHRTSRSFAMTELGADVYRHAAAMLIEAEAAQSAVYGRLAEPSGTVRITASVPTAQMLLAPILPEMALAYPKMRITLHTSDRFVDLVQEGYDISLRSHFAALPDSGMIQRKLDTDPVYLVAAPAYLAKHGTPEAIADLTGRDGLLSEIDEKRWILHGPSNEKVSVTPSLRYRADEGVALLAAARAGLGITALPSKFCKEDFVNGNLVRVLPGWTAGSVTTTLLTPFKRGQLPSVRAAIDFIAARLGYTAG